MGIVLIGRVYSDVAIIPIKHVLNREMERSWMVSSFESFQQWDSWEE